MIASFSLLTEEEFLALSRELTVFLFPVGGLEAHGGHLPMGTKLLQAEDLTRALAESLHEKMTGWTFVMMPLLPLTVDTFTSKVSFGVRAHVVRDAIVDQCSSFKRLGFLNFAVVSSHLTPRQLSALEDASKIVSKGKANLLSITSAMVQSKDVWKSPMIGLPSEHGGARDTSWVLKVNPKLVSPQYSELPEVAEPKASPSRFMSYYGHKIDGYWGKPAQANPITFQQNLNQEISELSIKLQVVLEKNQGKSFFKSGYRYYLLNGSFFQAYLLAMLFFVMMLVWIMWSLRDVFNA